MPLPLSLPREAWRRTGMVNVAMILVCGVSLLICLLCSLFMLPTRSITTSRTIHDGDCTYAERLNLVLHLLINVFSTCVLASSNFFMQIISSPSRQEVNQAHRLLCSLDIGIPSVKNIFFLARLKLLGWVLLMISSVPIHLLFNSAVYETGFQGSDWRLTLATEAFVNEPDSYTSPGASLSVAGSVGPGSFRNKTNGYMYRGYGDAVNLTDYWNNSSPINQNITSTAKTASSWERLSVQDCFKEYKFCTPKTKYRDVVVVIDSQGSNWTRSEIFNFDSSSNLSSLWDGHVPPNNPNSLWFSAYCSSVVIQSFEGPTDFAQSGSICSGYNCAGALGDPAGIAWLNTTELSGADWIIDFLSPSHPAPSQYGFNPAFNSLNVSYCLAELSPDNTCKVNVSNTLLAIVTGCVFLKIIVCVIVLFRLPQSSLVTPGDALESFIAWPDKTTVGLGTLEIEDSHRLEFRKRQLVSSTELATGLRTRRWKDRSRRLMFYLSREVWLRTYSIIVVGIAVMIIALAVISQSNGLQSFHGAFGPSDSNLVTDFNGFATSYTASLLAANCGQLLLSIAYFAYSSFFVRIQTEREWNSYSLSYKPLRVSSPKGGDQMSTYRLQLPYWYSIPLIGMSILLHWLLSNAIFIFVKEGGFWDKKAGGSVNTDDFGVSGDAIVAIGFSPPAVLTLFLVCTALSFVPVLLAWRKLPGQMVAGGWNSLVLSAACHASVLARQGAEGEIKDNAGSVQAKEIPVPTGSDGITDETQTQPMMEVPLRTQGTVSGGRYEPVGESDEQPHLENMAPEEREQHELTLLRQLTLSKVRWGAIAVDPDLVGRLAPEEGEKVMHLGFGSAEDHVQPVQDGHLYI